MNILDVLVNEPTPIMKGTDWRVEKMTSYDNLPASWIGRRAGQVSPALIKAMFSKTGIQLLDTAHYLKTEANVLADCLNDGFGTSGLALTDYERQEYNRELLALLRARFVALCLLCENNQLN